MKIFEKPKILRNSSSKGSRSHYSTRSSAFATRNTSPLSAQTIAALTRKVAKLRNKLSDAYLIITQHEQEREIDKKTQKEFLKNYHMKMFALNKNTKNNDENSNFEEKISEERNALEMIWQRRYDEMKKIYESKIEQLNPAKTLCAKCKAFVKTNEKLKEKIELYKLSKKNSQ